MVNGWLEMTAICHLSFPALCRSHCPEHCESMHCQHPPTDYGKCIAVEWVEAEGAQELADPTAGTFPIFDGMPIVFQRNEYALRWGPER